MGEDMDQPMTAIDVVRKIARGDVYGQRITFPEGLTIREMAALYESRGLGKARDFIDASRKVALIQDLDRRVGIAGMLAPAGAGWMVGGHARRSLGGSIDARNAA